MRPPIIDSCSTKTRMPASPTTIRLCGLLLLGLFIIGGWSLASHTHAQASMAAPCRVDTVDASPAPTGEISEPMIDGLVRYAMQSHRLPGVVLSVVRGGRLVLARGWGHARLDAEMPADPRSTLFRVASISKPVTFTAIMQLVEAGHLDLDAPISDYLDDVEIRGSSRYGPITMRHLMTHTAGFEDTYVGHFHADSPDTDASRTAYLNRYQPERVRAPGETISYSNYGVALAGQVLENLTAQPFAQAMDRNLLQPIGMTRTSFRDGPRLDTSLAKARARAYRWHRGQYEAYGPPYVPQGLYPAGSMSTTATDMARFMRAHLNAGAIGEARLLEPRTTSTMHRVIARNADGVPGNAHGFWSGRVAGYETLEHGGSVLGFRANLVMVPELDLGIFVATNGDEGGVFTDRLPRLLIRSAVSPASSSLAESSPQAHARASEDSLTDRFGMYEGAYLTTRRGYTTIDKIIALTQGIASVTATPSGHLVMTGRGAPRRYAPLGNHRFINVDTERVIAFEVPGARATRIHTAMQSFERIGFWQTASAFYLVLFASVVVCLGILVGFLIRRGRSTTQPPTERWARIVLGGTAACWLVSIGTLVYRLMNAPGPDRPAFVHFPPDGLVATALWGTLCSTILTGVTVLGLIPIWRHRSWGSFGALRYTGAVAVFTVLTFMLMQWNAIGVHVTGG